MANSGGTQTSLNSGVSQPQTVTIRPLNDQVYNFNQRTNEVL